MDRSFNWEHLRTFLSVVKEGGLSQAARDRGLSQPTAGRHVDALEQSLGEALFTRSRNGMTPTAAALRLVPHAEAMQNAAAALRRSATTDETDIRGPIRLTAPEIVAQEVLPPILTSFIERFPAIELELVASNDALDLLTREADIAVRTIRPEQQAIVARKVGACRIGLFARHTYIDAQGMPETMEQLSQHRLIGYDRNPMAVRMTEGLGIHVTPDMFSFRSDSETTQLEMLRAGYGIGGVQEPLAKLDPDLVPVMPDVVRFDMEIWLAMHERLKNSLPMRLLMDHLAKGLSVYISAVQTRAE
jgi:DNA-binding transcriptional LysR family regulator